MASRSLNRVILIGNLTRDPELKYTPSGTAVCSFGVATNRTWKTAEGEIKEDTQYHRIIAWQKLAELCAKLLTKGRKLYLEGRLVYRTFTGRDGVQRTVSEIILDDFIVFGDGRRISEEDAESGTKAVDQTTEHPQNLEDNQDVTDAEAAKSETKKKTQKAEAAEKAVEKNESEDVNPDDIPF